MDTNGEWMEIKKKTMQHNDAVKRKEAAQLLLLGSLEHLLEVSVYVC